MSVTTTALDAIGELRAATTDEERARVLLETRALPRWADLRGYAEGYDPDVLAPDRLVEWSVVTDAIGRTDRYTGQLTVAGVALKVLNMDAVTRRWSTRPGWYVLDLWEGAEWVRTHGAEHRDAPRRCLETVEAYHLEGATISEVRLARAAALDAAYAAADAAAYAAGAPAAYAAAYAAYATNADSDAAAAHAAVAAAHAADAVASRSAGSYATAYAEEAARCHTHWRWHLVRAALLDGGSR